MKMIIETYWNKLGPMVCGMRKVMPEYELKDSIATDSGWKSIEDFRKSCKVKNKFLGETRPGEFKFDLNRYYGIHSFQVIRFE